MKKSKKSLAALLLAFPLCALPCAGGAGALAAGEAGESFTSGPFAPAAPLSVQAFGTPAQRLQSMEAVCADGTLELYYDKTTAQIALLDRSSGQTFFSAPYDAGSDSASDEIRQKISAPLRIVYYDASKQAHEMNSYTDAAVRGQIATEKLKNGVAATLVLGSPDQRRLLPPAVPQSSFNENILANLDGQAAVRVKRFYKLYDLSGYDDAGMREELVKKFPGIEKTAVYSIRDLSESEKKELEEYLKSAGYSYGQMDRDLKEVGLEEESAVLPCFELRVEYTLEDGGLAVRVPGGRVKYDKSRFALQKIHLLEYFGASKRNDDGYLFIPDGSGALVDFVKDKPGSGVPIGASVYGADASRTFDRTGYTKKQMRMPVFGVKKQDSAFLGVIENGAEICTLTAVSGEAESSYNKIWCSFDYNAADTYVFKDLNSQRYWTQVDTNPFAGDITVRYIPLHGERADYSGMAAAYREYLIGRGQLSAKAEESPLPLYVGLLGAVDTKSRFLFLPVTKSTAMTSFGDAETIASELAEDGIENLNIRYFGWANGGLESTVFNRARIMKSLGGKKAFERLAAALAKRGVGLYPEVETLFAGQDKAFDGFSPGANAAKMLNGTYSRTYPIDLGTNLEITDRMRLALHPDAVLNFFSRFLKKYPYHTGLSLGSIGAQLNSSFEGKNPYNREQSMKISQKVMKTASGRHGLMVDAGNAYAYPYAEHILNMDSTSSAFLQSAKSVPFMQMVLHGCISYAGEPVNLSSESQKPLLKAVENGEGLYFLLTAKNSAALLGTAFKQYYSTSYEKWKEPMKEMYFKAAAALKDTSAAQMVRHEYVADDVVKVTYSNGVQIAVNYGAAAAEVDGFRVPPEDFARIAGPAE